MSDRVRRIFVEKKAGFDVQAQGLLSDIKESLGINSIKGIRLLNRYDISGISDEVYEGSKFTIFAEPPVDYVYDEVAVVTEGDRVFAVEYLPGQYDQRADSAAQCIQILSKDSEPTVRAAKVYALSGDISDAEFAKIKAYCINPIDSREADLEKPASLEMKYDVPADVKVLDGFNALDEQGLRSFMEEYGLAMNYEDLEFCQGYFRDTEKREPSITEIRVIDTYWSDHCRHTTFDTQIESVQIDSGKYAEPVKAAYESMKESISNVSPEKSSVCLMDIATLGMKEMRKNGMLDDLEVSKEINACSIEVEADVDGRPEKWLVMFKNETHNHPTEIEPFGGAATCLGGAIRDPLSGRSYVYQAMRVTGSADPRTPIEKTLPGKLAQRKITTEAARGYSSYGNQIGLATGMVSELYDEDFVAKRMEVGAVIAAAPKDNVLRGNPEPSDIVILVGGRTGRDGCGGATGSSKEHTEESLTSCGAEVQKGNAPTERKIQRLFRNAQVAKMIKRCNDFGAGGVSVAIGELTDGLDIDLDMVPKKYEGLDGTELAISESQERMAVVVSKDDAEKFISMSAEENLEATIVATVTGDRRLKMNWRGKSIVDLSRDFLDTNGIRQKTSVQVAAPQEESYFEAMEKEAAAADIEKTWKGMMSDLNICSQKGMGEMFDGTIGVGSVLMPYGGKYQDTPAQVMVAKLPVLGAQTSTATAMSFGYNPKIGKWSPFHGAMYAVVESVAKLVAAGVDHKRVRLSLQEYFEKLRKEPQRWGKPFSALLGAYMAQKGFGTPAIGGKDSMSGSFNELDVPPTLISFAVGVVKSGSTVSSEFKKAGSQVVMYKAPVKDDLTFDFDALTKDYESIHALIESGKVLSSYAIGLGGAAEAVTKMGFGNRIGIELENIDNTELFAPGYGSIVLELEAGAGIGELAGCKVIGKTTAEAAIKVAGVSMDMESLYKLWEAPLEEIFPTRTGKIEGTPMQSVFKAESSIKSPVKIAKPRVFIPAFPGTNCEYDSARAFNKAGAEAQIMVLKNLTPAQIEASIEEMVNHIRNSQIVMIPGGFSAGDEPEGSGKFIATVFKNPYVKEAVMELLTKRDGLVLGICNGFQALIKLGLLPYGEIRDVDASAPTLTYNKIGRHVSKLIMTKVVSNKSPWLANIEPGSMHTIPVSHGEGRFFADEATVKSLFENGQIATQYVDFDGNPTYDIAFNPNGSVHAIEGITSPDGRVFGKMAHSERVGKDICKNIPGNKEQDIFKSGVSYFL